MFTGDFLSQCIYFVFLSICFYFVIESSINSCLPNTKKIEHVYNDPCIWDNTSLQPNSLLKEEKEVYVVVNSMSIALPSA